MKQKFFIQCDDTKVLVNICNFITSNGEEFINDWNWQYIGRSLIELECTHDVFAMVVLHYGESFTIVNR